MAIFETTETRLISSIYRLLVFFFEYGLFRGSLKNYHGIMTQILKIFSIVGLFMSLLAGCSQAPKKEADATPFKLHIGDGRVYLEQSHHHLVDERRGMASAKWSSFVYFQPSTNSIAGTVWTSDSGPYEPKLGADTRCDVTTEKSHYEKSTEKSNPTVLVRVKVTDGIEGGPFDTVINGESEGEIQFGQYPLRDWKAIENLVLDETLIKEWSYSKKDKLYRIVKKMGETQYLKKEIKVGHQVRGIASVRYEILEEVPGVEEGTTRLEPLARLQCGNF